MDNLLKRINQGYDGIIRETRIYNENKNAEVIVSVIDLENNREWVNIIFIIREIKEFKLIQKLNYSNIILSDGIKIKKLGTLVFIDFAPYSDEIDTIDDIRCSENYFGCEFLDWKIIPYME